MTARKLTGPGAGVEKYDLITAMAVISFSGSPTLQTSIMRLIAMVTSRYNWARDEVSIGQRELASLWNVDERTAKREVKRLLEGGLLVLKCPGIRGRVAVYRLNIGKIYQNSHSQWGAVGPDFSARMKDNAPAQGQNVVRVDFGKTEINREPGSMHPVWQTVCGELQRQDHSCFNAWFAKIECVREEENVLILKAPTNFIARYVSDKLSEKLRAVIIGVSPSLIGFSFEQ